VPTTRPQNSNVSCAAGPARPGGELKRNSVTSASRRLVLLQVGAAPARQGIKTNPKCQRERRAGAGGWRLGPGARRGPPSAVLGAAAVRGFGIPGVDLRRARGRRPPQLFLRRPGGCGRPPGSAPRAAEGHQSEQTAAGNAVVSLLRLVLLQVGAARGTSPTRDKDQPEMSESPAWSAFGGPWGRSGPRLRDSGGGFAARARTAGPGDPDHPRTTHVLRNRRLADACCLAHLTDAEPQLMRQPQHLTDLPHRHSHPRHRSPLCCSQGLPIC
jgi:hypothetical protein